MKVKHTECYRKDYPRPQFVRDSFIDLNGEWDFCFDFDNGGEAKHWENGLPEGAKKIKVPFAYQTTASGIGETKRCDNVWYARKFTPSVKKGESPIINFEGVDYTVKVWLNGTYLGSHTGAYSRASFNAGAAVKSGENLLVVKAEDSYSCRRPRGKQRSTDNSYTCWYVDTTGIWKSVWAEKVADAYLEYVHITPDFDTLTAMFEGKIAGNLAGLKLKTYVKFGGKVISETAVTVTDSRVSFVVSVDCEAHFFSDMLWRGGDPHLYDVTFVLERGLNEVDKIGSYFGMVKYRSEKNCINVNDTPVYLKMLLDQGYWKDSHLTPPSEEAIEKDILLTLEAGFNGIRKHQKIEDERFYYYCDILGVYVWCEMPSMYEFNTESVNSFINEWQEVVLQNRNHPCIMAYVPFNESWGIPAVHGNRRQQQFTESAYHLTKTLDSNKLVIANDGWDQTVTDIVTIHNYAENGDTLTKIYENGDAMEDKMSIPFGEWRHVFADGYKYEGQPVLISEFGGIAFSADGNKGWGYGNLVADEDVFLSRLKSLVLSIKRMRGVCGYCLTQTTDVQQEVNGVLTEERKWKVDVKKLKEINDA